MTMWKYVYVIWDYDVVEPNDVIFGNTEEDIKKEVEERGLVFVEEYLYTIKSLDEVGSKEFIEVEEAPDRIVVDYETKEVYWET